MGMQGRLILTVARISLQIGFDATIQKNNRFACRGVGFVQPMPRLFTGQQRRSCFEITGAHVCVALRALLGAEVNQSAK